MHEWTGQLAGDFVKDEELEREFDARWSNRRDWRFAWHFRCFDSEKTQKTSHRKRS